MYYPIQIPYILNENFLKYAKYSEKQIKNLKDFAICFWEIQSIRKFDKKIKNVIVSDGCIDFVVDFNGKRAGFCGMSKTNFNFEISYPAASFGIRFKPGAFYNITGIPAQKAMDKFLPAASVWRDFDSAAFFKLPLKKAQKYICDHFKKIIKHKTPDRFVTLFDKLHDENILDTKQLYGVLGVSSRQCQRLCLKHFAVSPKMLLSIIRFHKSVESLISGKTALYNNGYYDQPHYIKDIKKYVGITPAGLIKKYG